MSGVDSDLVILVPVLGRPHHVAPLMESIREATPHAKVLWLLSEGDNAVLDEVKVWRVLEPDRSDYVVLPPRERGDYAMKINIGYRLTDEPYLFTGASDLKFRPGWFEAAVKHMERPEIGVVGTNDVYSRRAGSHATHFLVRRSYVSEVGTSLDGPGIVWPRAYMHEFGDDELEGVVRKAGAYVLEPAAEVPHDHPLWPAAPSYQQWDEIRNEAAMIFRQNVDRKLYLDRRRQWAG